MISKQEWILNLVRENKIVDTRPLTPPQIQDWLNKYNQFFGGMCTEESFRRSLRKAKQTYLLELSMDSDEYDEEEETEYISKDPDEEILEANVRLQKQKQKYMDSNRLERKSFREYARVENAVSEYAKEIKETLQQYGEKLTRFNPEHIMDYTRDEVGILQITDVHWGELIDLAHNQYDMKISSHRLFKFYKESASMFKARGVKEVVVALTGDLTNSQRRLDEMMNMANNLSKVTFVAVDLLYQFLHKLTNDFKVSVVSVLGNESRVHKEMGFSNEVLSDNHDFTIVNMTRILMEATGNKNITFGTLDEVETIIEVKGHKILLTHDVPKASNSQKGTQSVIGMKYLQGNPVDCLLAGHLHSTMNQMYGYRSSALCGSNSYSDHALHLAGRAGQNIYFIGEGYRHVMSIDLQNYNEDEWFDINASIVKYECKSIEKTRKKETIMSIVI